MKKKIGELVYTKTAEIKILKKIANKTLRDHNINDKTRQHCGIISIKNNAISYKRRKYREDSKE